MATLDNDVSQVDKTEVKIMDRAIYREGLKTYKQRLGGRGPCRESSVSIEQYTAFIVAVVDLDEIYVGLAVWGPNADRIIKNKAFQGVAFGPDGRITTVEMKGPPTFAVWLAAFRVFRVACVMKAIVEPETLDNYIAKIEKLHAKNPRCWALLYQAEHRTRLEHMPRVRDAMQEEHDDAIHDGKHPDRLPFNPKQPWEGVFQRVTFEEKDWWDEQYNDLCFLYYL